MVSFEEFTDIYDVLYALGYAPERGLDEEELERRGEYDIIDTMLKINLGLKNLEDLTIVSHSGFEYKRYLCTTFINMITYK